MSAIVTRWYAGRRCVLCSQMLLGPETRGHRSALIAPDGRTREWSEVAPEELPAVLATHHAVCWNCHVAESFRRAHPELVYDRPPHHASQTRLGGASR